MSITTQDSVLIVGHKNPDSDSICSAIAYAYFKSKMGINAIPIRAGEINRETEFILNYFKVEQPRYLASIRTKVSDLRLDELKCIRPFTSIYDAWQIMKTSKIQLLPVIDAKDKLVGLVSLIDITSIFFDTSTHTTISDFQTPLSNIAATLQGTIVLGDRERTIQKGKVVIAAMTPDEMKNFISEGDIVIVANRVENQRAAIQLGAELLILSGGSELSPEVYEEAFNNSCAVIITELDTFASARLIIQSVPINTLMSTENIVSFTTDDLVEEIKPKMIERRHKLYPVVDNEGKVVGGIARYHLISRMKKKVILLDHNEKMQSIHGIEEAEIIEIVDHHKIGDIQSNYPIYLRNEPVGSTATIITSIMMENDIRIPTEIAGILCAAIISDTLKFKSPTCTEKDKQLAYYLAGLAKIDIDDFSMKMFKAGSSFEGKSEEAILFGDFKEFRIKDYHIGISQITLMSLEATAEIKENLRAYVRSVIKNLEYDAILVLFTDINQESSELIVVEKNGERIQNALAMKEASIFLEGLVSRKKQLVPLIAQNL